MASDQGAVITVEPGVYLPERGFGVRIEDEVLVTDSGYRLLTTSFPRKLEDVESVVYLRGGDFNVFGELHRIAQRQFHWQRGYLNLPQFYRYAFIYAQGKCGEYFEKTYGLPITELNFVGFVLFAQSMCAPWISSTFTIPELELVNPPEWGTVIRLTMNRH